MTPNGLDTRSLRRVLRCEERGFRVSISGSCSDGGFHPRDRRLHADQHLGPLVMFRSHGVRLAWHPGAAILLSLMVPPLAGRDAGTSPATGGSP